MTSHKDSALDFLRLAAFGHVDEAYEKYTSSDFIHHNAYFKGDKQSLMKAMKEASVEHPNKAFNVQFALEDGDKVAVYSQVQTVADGPDIAVVHMFRFLDDLIVEMWDVGLHVPDDSPNEHGMF